jgi:hypothetical protein
MLNTVKPTVVYYTRYQARKESTGYPDSGGGSSENHNDLDYNDLDYNDFNYNDNVWGSESDDPLMYFKKNQPQPPKKPLMKNPKWVKKIFPNNGDSISLIYVPKDGNCMFTCIGKAFDVPLLKLRALVAQSIILPDNDSTVIFWREIYRAAWIEKDVTLMHEYSQVADLNDKPLEDILTVKDKYKIHDNIMTSAFWGEEFSIRTLESLLTLRIIIINGDTNSINDAVIHDTPYGVNYYIIIYLKNKHYSLVSYNGDTRFKRTELPWDIKDQIS